MVVRVTPALFLLLACGGDDAFQAATDRPPEQVALVPVTARHDVDVLFVLDDSVGGLEMQTSLRAALPAFVAELAATGMPNLHVGAVTSDLGSQGAEDAEPGPTVGTGPGSCAGVGKAAALMTGSSSPITGNFLVDVSDGAGGRTTNYAGSLADALSAFTYFGGSGCGFEQPIEAMKRALDNHPDNVDFLRPDATLAVIMLTDEDDCSFAHATLLDSDTSVLGPLQSFRCTQFGVACDDGGVTPEDMATPGVKSGCHWREDSAYLTSRARYESFLSALKADRRDILLAAIAGDPSVVEVEMRSLPTGGSMLPTLAHACTFTEAEGGPGVANPAVRIHDLLAHAPRSRFESLCAGDLAPAATAIAREIRGMLGDSCLTRDIRMPADCEVFDQTPTGETQLPPCSATTTTDCYQLVEDPACTTSQRLRVEVMRSATPAADTMVAVRCKL